VTLQPQFTIAEVAGVENIAALQTVASLETPFEQMVGRVTTVGAAVASIANLAQQAAQGIDLGLGPSPINGG